MVSDVRNFSYRILDNLTGDGNVPLPALGWSEVLVYGVEACAGADAGDIILESWANRIQAAEGRIIAKLGISALGVDGGIFFANRRRPGRVTSQTQHIFDDVRTAHKATESGAHRGLTITFDVPGHTDSRLEALVIWMPQ